MYGGSGVRKDLASPVDRAKQPRGDSEAQPVLPRTFLAELRVGALGSARGTILLAIGHLAWGYLAGRSSSQALRVEAKALVLLVVAILPDLDTLLRLAHRGPTHSLLLVIVAFTLAFARWGWRVIPYFAALAQHGLTDALDPMGAQLLWPVAQTYYSLRLWRTGDTLHLAAEWTGFLLSLAMIAKVREVRKLLKPARSNLLALVPLGALLTNALFWRMPSGLMIPTATYLGLLSIPILADIRSLARSAFRKATAPSG